MDDPKMKEIDTKTFNHAVRLSSQIVKSHGCLCEALYLAKDGQFTGKVRVGLGGDRGGDITVIEHDNSCPISIADRVLELRLGDVASG